MEVRILIISRDTNVRNQIYQILYPMGYDCYLVSTCLAASVICKMFDPDIAMIDFSLPVQDITQILEMLPDHISCNIIAILPQPYQQTIDLYDIKYNLTRPISFQSTMDLFSSLPGQ